MYSFWRDDHRGSSAVYCGRREELQETDGFFYPYQAACEWTFLESSRSHFTHAQFALTDLLILMCLVVFYQHTRTPSRDLGPGSFSSEGTHNFFFLNASLTPPPPPPPPLLSFDLPIFLSSRQRRYSRPSAFGWCTKPRGRLVWYDLARAIYHI